MTGRPAAGHLRVLSANLWNGRADAAAFARLVAAVEPDVVAVQELTPEQAEALARVLPAGQLDPSRDYKGMGIALRAPRPVRRIPLPYRAAWVVEVPASGAPGATGPTGEDAAEAIEVINVHILAPHAPPPWRAAARRLGQLRGLETYLDATPHRPRLVVGDLNSTPLWPLYRRLTTRLTDAAVEAARRTGERPRRTWGPWAGAARLLRIDHALVGGLVVHDVRVLPIRGSDHAALLVDVSANGVRAPHPHGTHRG